jgi:hypothetical protein
MSGGGVCYPNRHTIATATGYAVRTVERAVTRLERQGWLRVERGAGRASNQYTALLPVVASESRHREWLVATTATRSGDSDDRSGDTRVARKQLKAAESAGSAAAALSGYAAAPEDECPRCRRIRPLVTPDYIHCAECAAGAVEMGKCRGCAEHGPLIADGYCAECAADVEALAAERAG